MIQLAHAGLTNRARFPTSTHQNGAAYRARVVEYRAQPGSGVRTGTAENRFSARSKGQHDMPTVAHIRPMSYQTCTEKPIDKGRCRCWLSAESPR